MFLDREFTKKLLEGAVGKWITSDGTKLIANKMIITFTSSSETLQVKLFNNDEYLGAILTDFCRCDSLTVDGFEMLIPLRITD